MKQLECTFFFTFPLRTTRPGYHVSRIACKWKTKFVNYKCRMSGQVTWQLHVLSFNSKEIYSTVMFKWSCTVLYESLWLNACDPEMVCRTSKYISCNIVDSVCIWWKYDYMFVPVLIYSIFTPIPIPISFYWPHNNTGVRLPQKYTTNCFERKARKIHVQRKIRNFNK